MYYDNFCKSLSGWPTAKLLRIPLNPTLAKHSGIKCSISTMYRGAVPITEHLPADVLEPLRGTEWRGASRPHKGTTLRSLRFSRSFVPLWGWGYAKPLRGFCYTDFCWRDGGILTPVDFLRAFDRLYSDSGLLTHFLLPSAFRSPTSTFSRRGSLRPLAVVLY